jgi:hypothetical protein
MAFRGIRLLADACQVLGEARVKELLEEEMESENPRRTALRILHQRYCILRAKRERKEIMKCLTS